MFDLKSCPPTIDPELILLLQAVEPATMGHFLHFGVVEPAIHALWQVPRIAGTAVTCRCAGLDGTVIQYAVDRLREGDVLVIDRVGDHRAALVGGTVAYAAVLAGAVGIIVDGFATDIAEIRQHALPVWARGLSVLTTKRLMHNGEFCVPVTCGGVTVTPGDAILADENGILVLKPDMIREAAGQAIDMQAAERKLHAAMGSGRPLSELTGTDRILRDILAAQDAHRGRPHLSSNEPVN